MVIWYIIGLAIVNVWIWFLFFMLEYKTSGLEQKLSSRYMVITHNVNDSIKRFKKLASFKSVKKRASLAPHGKIMQYKVEQIVKYLNDRGNITVIKYFFLEILIIVVDLPFICACLSLSPISSQKLSIEILGLSYLLFYVMISSHAFNAVSDPNTPAHRAVLISGGGNTT